MNFQVAHWFFLPKHTKSVEWQKLSSFEFKRAYSVLNGVNVECLCVYVVVRLVNLFIYTILYCLTCMTGIIVYNRLAEDLELQ